MYRIVSIYMILLFLQFHLIAKLVEADAEMFRFHPSTEGYLLQGTFEIPTENFIGNQFWLCFDYKTEKGLKHTRSNLGSDYPAIQCGGEMIDSDSYWFALNGEWLSDKRLEIRFVNVPGSSEKLLSRNFTWTDSDETELSNTPFLWQMTVNFQDLSSVKFSGMPKFNVPEMDTNFQVQIKLNGFGAALRAVVPNLNTIVLSVPTYVQI